MSKKDLDVNDSVIVIPPEERSATPATPNEQLNLHHPRRLKRQSRNYSRYSTGNLFSPPSEGGRLPEDDSIWHEKLT